MKQPKVSIIVPIYNSAKYIERCLVSLFEQTLDDLEYLFINDGSTDNSMELLEKILKKYPYREAQVKIFDNKINQGIAVTRNTGITNANGNYIIHCDSDDWVEKDMYKTMYDTAVSGNYDIVYCDYYRVIKNISLPKKSKTINNSIQAIKTMLNSPENVTRYIWDKLIKRELYINNDIQFSTNFNIQEDFSTTIRLFYFSKKIAHIPIPFYYYEVKDESLSKTNTKYEDNDFRINDRIKASNFNYDFFKQQNALHLFNNEINSSKLRTKYVLILNSQNIKPLLGLFPEANKNICSSPLPISMKFVAYFASINSLFLVKISLWVIRFILKPKKIK